MQALPHPQYCVALALMLTVAAAMAQSARSCAVNADDVAVRVKAILGPSYASAPDSATLAANHGELERLLLEAGHCSASARSHDTQVADRQRNIMEWHSVNQWLNRLVGVMALNTRGDMSSDWRDEYTLFAEIYEFEP